MSKSTVHRHSALDGHYVPGKSGELQADGSAGVVLENILDLELHQVAGWADTMERVAASLAKAAKAASAPSPGQVVNGQKGSLLRVEPLKWWLVGCAAPKMTQAWGTSLDLSHSRTRIRISGPHAQEFLNRFLPLDLRETSFTMDSVASSAIHHVGVTVWRSNDHFELFIPRGFALFVWEGLVDVARQFGLEVV